MNEEKGVDRNEYLAAVLSMYLEMPETPWRAIPTDRDRACDLYQRRIPLSIVESAFLLGSLRRLGRPPESPRLSPIGSLVYFVPVIEGLFTNPFPEGYLDYLRYKVREISTPNLQPDQTGTSSKKYTSS